MNNPLFPRQPSRSKLQPKERFDPILMAKGLLRGISAGALATLAPATNHPFASMVSVASAMDGAPLLLLSDLALHSKHLKTVDRMSLLLAAQSRGNPMIHPRLTLVGTARKISDPLAKARFLRRHPKAALYADFADFAMAAVTIESGHLNGGFGRAATLSATDVIVQTHRIDAFSEQEADMIAMISRDQSAAIQKMGLALSGRRGRWRLVSLDPEGCDLMLGEQTVRGTFPSPVAAPDDWLPAFFHLSDKV